MHGDLSEVSVQQLLEKLRYQTGLLSIRDAYGHQYQLRLHQGTLQVLHVNGLLVSQRSQVVKTVAILLGTRTGSYAFTTGLVSDFEETTPMNLARLVESALQDVLKSAQSAPIATTKHIGLPASTTNFLLCAVEALPQMRNDHIWYWQTLKELIPQEGAGLNAQDLANMLNVNLTHMRVLLFRFHDNGLIQPAPTQPLEQTEKAQTQPQTRRPATAYQFDHQLDPQLSELNAASNITIQTQTTIHTQVTVPSSSSLGQAILSGQELSHSYEVPPKRRDETEAKLLN